MCTPPPPSGSPPVLCLSLDVPQPCQVLLRNVTGLLGAMVAVGIFLNILNRYTNKRRRKKLKESIFTLPVYVYPSRERRAAALKEARSLVGETAAVCRDAETHICIYSSSGICVSFCGLFYPECPGGVCVAPLRGPWPIYVS